MDCKVCKQDIASFIKVDKILESDIPYLKCKCPYCNSTYKIVNKTAKNIVIIDKTSRTYEQDLYLAKRVKLSEVNECSISEVTDEMVNTFHPNVVDTKDFIIPIWVNPSYSERRELLSNASVAGIIFIEE